MRIPRHTSQREITGASPSVEMPTQDPVGQAITQAGQALQSIGSNLIEAKVFQETTQAELDYSSGLNVILAEAKQDTDIDNPETLAKYNSRISDLRSKVSRGLRVPKSKNQFGIYSEKHAISAKAELAKTATKMVVDKGIAGTLETLESWKNQYATAGDAETREMLIGQGENKIDEAVRQGFWTHEKGFREKQKMRKEWAKEAVSVIASNVVDDETKSIAEQQVLDLPLSAKEKNDAMDLIEKTLGANERAAKRETERRQEENIVNLVNEIQEGTKGPADIWKAVEDGEIDMTRDQAVAAIVQLRTERIKPNKEDLMGILDAFSDPGTSLTQITTKIMTSSLPDKTKQGMRGVLNAHFKGAIDLQRDTPWRQAYGFMKDFFDMVTPKQANVDLVSAAASLLEDYVGGKVESKDLQQRAEELSDIEGLARKELEKTLGSYTPEQLERAVSILRNRRRQ